MSITLIRNHEWSCGIVLVALLLAAPRATAADCDANGLPDECDLSCGTVGGACDLPGCGQGADCDGDEVLDACEISQGAHCRFPTRLAGNTTGAADSRFLGPPDEVYYGLGGQVVTYALGCLLEDGAGADFTVYEVDSGSVEFSAVDVLVSADGFHFVSVKSSESAAVRVPGDSAYANLQFARSYDLASVGLSRVYMIRLDGSGTGAAGSTNGFDLDAIGLIHGRDDCNGNGVPDSCDVSSGATDCNSNGLPDACEPDCNGNGLADTCDLRDKTSNDCNLNGVPDECDTNPVDPDGNGEVSGDCNHDTVPDECITCPPVDLVFVMDTSASMEDEGAAICNNIVQVADKLAARGIQVQSTLLGVSEAPGGIFSCLTGSVIQFYGTAVPGSPPPDNSVLGQCPGGNEVALEDWGRAVSVVAGRRAWPTDALRLIVPISDEGPWCGNPVSDPGVDRDSILHAITIASQNAVIVSPITGSGSGGAVVEMASLLASQTGGTHFPSSNADQVASGIETIVLKACSRAGDCNANNIPDQCDMDPTDPDGNGQVSGDCNTNSIPDECEADCNADGIPDDCDLALGLATDCDGNGELDNCQNAGVVRIGDRDDFDNADGDSEPNLVTGSSVEYPGTGTGETTGEGEMLTDVSITSGQRDYTFLFSVPARFYAGAKLRVLTLDVDRDGWPATPIMLDGVDSGFRLTPVATTTSYSPGYVRLDEFPLTPEQLAMLTDGALEVTFKSGAGVPTDDGAVFDYVELEYALADCDGNQTPDFCEPDQDGDGIPDPCDQCPGTVPGAVVDALGCPPRIPGDFNRDGDVDCWDLETFVACATGPSVGCVPPPVGCPLSLEEGGLPSDFDRDIDVDQVDFALFQRCYSGEGKPADPMCGD